MDEVVEVKIEEVEEIKSNLIPITHDPNSFKLDVPRDNTNFSLTVEEVAKNIIFDEKAYLKLYQKVIIDYFVNNSNVRGLLLYFEMGFGKTLTAAIIMQILSQNMKVVVISSKMLHENMKSTIDNLQVSSESKVDPIYITSNASNLVNILKSHDSFDNTLIVVDEAHDIFNSITNYSKGSIEFYNMIMNATNIKILFLTGTVIVNEPFELVPCFNMLAGYELFPENYEDFSKYFIDKKNKKFINRQKFKDRISGLVSYYGHLLSDISKNEDSKGIIKKEGFPDEYDLQVINVEMSEYQYGLYINARIKEREENMNTTSFKIKATPLQKPKSSGYSSYRVASRQISNFAFPENNIARDIEKLTKEELENPKYSTKFHKMIEMITNNKTVNQLKLVYSFFVNHEGILLIAKILETKGYKKFDLSRSNNSSMLDSKESKSSLTYAILSSDDDIETRDKIRMIFNSNENKHGEIINVMFISKSSAQGTDFKNVREVYITEPFYNKQIISQIIKRAVRLNSHIALPPEERIVKSYIFLSTAPHGKKGKFVEIKTTDEDLYYSAIDDEEINDQAKDCLIEGALDCVLYNKNPKYKCHLCKKTNRELFYKDFYKDIEIPSKCISVDPPEEETIKVDEYIIDNKKYYIDQSSKDVYIQIDNEELMQSSKKFGYDNNPHRYVKVDFSELPKKIQQIVSKLQLKS